VNDSNHPALEPRDGVSVKVKKLNLFYSGVQALKNVELDIPDRQVTAFIGPSGCGKSTLLRCFNRMNDLIAGCRTEGEIIINGNDVMKKSVDVAELRRRVGMVFQKPNPFPKSIFENIAYGPKIHGLAEHRADLEEIVVNSLFPMKLAHMSDYTIPNLNSHIEAFTMQTGCCFLDSHQRFSNSNQTIFQDDGVHLTEAAYEIWTRALLEHIAFLIEND